MNICPILLSEHSEPNLYSLKGLRTLHPRLKQLTTFQLSYEEQIQQARLRADKMSIQGVQPKLSATLNVRQGAFEVTDTGGTFILKPNPTAFEDVPANEALTMTMARSVGIEVPAHGLLPTCDESWIYIIKRFDRLPKRQKLHTEDFAQLTLATRDTKYDSSLEKVAKVITEFCTFPAVERPKLALRLLFCFLTGNEDMHLKNFSLIRDQHGTVKLSPAYDLLNTTLVLGNAIEESALPIHGKKRNLTHHLWMNYLTERLMLSEKQTTSLLSRINSALSQWPALITRSYLPLEKKERYIDLLKKRAKTLNLLREGWLNSRWEQP